jgi:hypothetical protein
LSLIRSILIESGRSRGFGNGQFANFFCGEFAARHVKDGAKILARRRDIFSRVRACDQSRMLQVVLISCGFFATRAQAPRHENLPAHDASAPCMRAVTEARDVARERAIHTASSGVSVFFIAL